MTLDGKLFGFVAIGDVIYFRAFSGDDLLVLFCPQDVDSHRLASSMNGMINILLEQVASTSEFKL